MYCLPAYVCCACVCVRATRGGRRITGSARAPGRFFRLGFCLGYYYRAGHWSRPGRRETPALLIFTYQNPDHDSPTHNCG